MIPAQGASGITLADAEKLLAEIVPAVVEQVIKAAGEGESPIEIGGQFLVDGLGLVSGAVLDLLEGKGAGVARRAFDDGLADLLERIKVGEPPLPL